MAGDRAREIVSGSAVQGGEAAAQRQFPAGTSRRVGVLWTASVALIYFATAHLSLSLVLQPSGIAPVWPPSGVFLAAILLTRRDLRPWLAGTLCLADFAAEMLAGTPPVVSLVYALTLTGDAVLSAWLLARFVSNPITFRRVREVVGWLLLSVVLSNSIAALVAASAASLQLGASFSESWRAWAISDGIGNLLITPLVLSWAAWRGVGRIRNHARELEAAALVVILVGLNWLAFFGLPALSEFNEVLTYLNFPFVMWAALRFGMRGVTSAVGIIAAVVVADVVTGGGHGPLNPTSAGNVALVVQVYLAVLAVPALVLAAESLERGDAEASRLASEQRHGITLRSIGDAVITTDTLGRVSLLNPVAEALTGWRQAEGAGRPIDEVFRIISEETRLPAESPVARVLRECAVVGLANHTLLVARDGAERPVADSGAPIVDERGQTLGVVLVFRDQTAERAADASLRQGRVLLQSVVDGTTDAIYAKDLQGRYTLFNAGAERIAGRRAAEVLGKDDTFLFPPSEAAVVMAGDRAVMAAGAPSTYEEHVTTAAGGVTTFLSTKGPIRDATGAVVGLFGIARDITERQAAEQAIRQMALVLDTAPNSITVHDFDGRFLYANPRTFEMHGYSRDEFMALNLAQVDVPADAALIAARMAELRERGEASFEVEHRRKDGVILPLVVTVKGTTWGGQDALLSIATDITERKRAEAEKANLQAQLQQAQKMESVGRLAGGVAHDFNNMLGAILGHAELALEAVGPSHSVRADLLEIQSAAKRSADLTRQLLAFARRQTVAPVVLDLNTTVSGMLDMLGRLVRAGIELTWKPGRDLERVRVDPSQIDQILVNLVVNAGDAIGDIGLITIETGNGTLDTDYCAAHPGALPGEYVVLTVSDNGGGMDAETMSHLFEPFFTTKETGKGTGLGLATVYGIVKQNAGFINAHSEAGIGTTFRVYLPRHRGRIVPPAAQTQGVAKSGGAETVLLVEDEPAILRLGTVMLERLDYRVVAAATPGEAIRLAREHVGEIHLLMTDVVMPEMDGRELAKNLLSLYPHLRRLFMSGYTADVIAHHGVLDEGVHFLQKPFSVDDLASAVRKALDRDPESSDSPVG